MNQQHSEQLQADRQNTDDMIAAGESNTTDIINNNNANTDKITNGYDNSGMLSENDRLNNSLDEYQKKRMKFLIRQRIKSTRLSMAITSISSRLRWLIYPFSLRVSMMVWAP